MDRFGRIQRAAQPGSAKKVLRLRNLPRSSKLALTVERHREARRMTSIDYQERDWQQRDARFDPAVVLTWVLGMGVAVFIATAF